MFVISYPVRSAGFRASGRPKERENPDRCPGRSQSAASYRKAVERRSQPRLHSLGEERPRRSNNRRCNFACASGQLKIPATRVAEAVDGAEADPSAPAPLAVPKPKRNNKEIATSATKEDGFQPDAELDTARPGARAGRESCWNSAAQPRQIEDSAPRTSPGGGSHHRRMLWDDA